LHLNIRAGLILAHHFGIRMRARGRGGMIFVSSTLAFAGVPTVSAYAASKAHNLIFAEGLARELGPAGIAVLALCPGPTRTEIWPPGATPALLMEPDTVAAQALNRLGRRTTAVAGLVNRLITLSTRFAPRGVNSRIFGSVVGRMFRNATLAKEPPVPQRDVPGVDLDERRNAR
jgi:short-subunit dehydrogenase